MLEIPNWNASFYSVIAVEAKELFPRRFAMPTDPESERKAFEKWAEGKKFTRGLIQPFLRLRSDETTYFYGRIQGAWESWQAAASRTAELRRVLQALLEVIEGRRMTFAEREQRIAEARRVLKESQ